MSGTTAFKVGSTKTFQILPDKDQTVKMFKCANNLLKEELEIKLFIL